jgi:hypothetical protein
VNWKRLVVFLVVQAVLVLGLTELVLRLVGPRSEALRQLVVEPASVVRIEGADTLEELMETTMVGFRPLSESFGFVLNSRSLRTKEYTEVKAAGTERVLAFGDSFTWASGGLPHRQHWPTILEERLAALSARPVEVLRFGVPATGPAFQLRLWQLEGSRLDADAVVVAFFVGNDFIDHQRELAGSALRPGGWRNRLVGTSMTIRLLINLRRALAATDDGGEITKAAAAEAGDSLAPVPGSELPGYREGGRFDRPKLEEERFLEIEARRMLLCHRSQRTTFETLLAGVAEVLVSFRDEVEATGARFLVMVIPDEYQVSPRLAAEIVERDGGSIGDYDLGLPQRRLTEVLGARGIELLDLLPVFAERGATMALYGTRDTHWNHAGNLLAADLLAERLVSGPPRSR